MAQSKRIKVMLSSRCNDRFPADSDQTLSNIREQVKREIEGTKLFGKQVFEVWINEDAPPADGMQDSWDACLQAVRDCDVLLVLSNGNAGWASGDGDIGICHAECMEGLATTRGKVRFIAMPNIPVDDGREAEAARNQRFQAFIAQQTPFRGGLVSTVDQLRIHCFRGRACRGLGQLLPKGYSATVELGADSAIYFVGCGASVIDWSGRTAFSSVAESYGQQGPIHRCAALCRDDVVPGF